MSWNNHRTGRRHWILASCQVSSNSVQHLQENSWKCLSQSEAGVAILFFPIGPKNTKLEEDIVFLPPDKFRKIPFSSFRKEVENVSDNQRPGRPSCFFDQPEKKNWKRTLSSCFLSCFCKFRSAVEGEKSKMSRPIRGRCGHLVFSIGPKNKYLVEYIKFLLPVKFRKIPLSNLRTGVENISVNQRLGRPSCFSDLSPPPEKKLDRGRWVLAYNQVSSNSV